MKLNGSQILLETLLEQGTDTIFGYPGGAALNIYDELYKYSDRIRHVLAAHEQGASHAADGYARATGKVGVVLVTSGAQNGSKVAGVDYVLSLEEVKGMLDARGLRDEFIRQSDEEPLKYTRATEAMVARKAS